MAQLGSVASNKKEKEVYSSSDEEIIAPCRVLFLTSAFSSCSLHQVSINTVLYGEGQFRSHKPSLLEKKYGP